jgi:hypothetical protein
VLATCWVVALGCGPQVDLEDEGSGSASSTGPDATTASPTTAGPTTASPTTAGSVTVTTGPGDPSTSGVDPDESDGSTGPVFPEDCSTIEQDCPRGYKCMPWASDGGNSWNDTLCVPIVEDPSAQGEPCMYVGSPTSGEDDCDGSSMCWNVDPKTNQGTCQPFCIGTDEEPTCPNPCDTCPQTSEGNINLCFFVCDPLIQNCDPGQACYPVQDSFACAPDASPKGTGIASPCEFINVCPPSMACLSADVVPGCPDGSAGCCAPFCPVGGADPCPGLLPFTSCVPWFEEGAGPLPECQSAPPGVCVQQ